MFTEAHTMLNGTNLKILRVCLLRRWDYTDESEVGVKQLWKVLIWHGQFSNLPILSHLPDLCCTYFGRTKKCNCPTQSLPIVAPNVRLQVFVMSHPAYPIRKISSCSYPSILWRHAYTLIWHFVNGFLRIHLIYLMPFGKYSQFLYISWWLLFVLFFYIGLFLNFNLDQH